MIQVKDGSVTKTKLPTTGYVNGMAVSNYHKLDSATLKAEGWLPVEKVEPTHDTKTQQMVFDKYEILATKVKEVYKAELIPEPQPSEIQVLTSRLSNLENELVKKEVITEEELTASR